MLQLVRCAGHAKNRLCTQRRFRKWYRASLCSLEGFLWRRAHNVNRPWCVLQSYIRNSFPALGSSSALIADFMISRSLGISNNINIKYIRGKLPQTHWSSRSTYVFLTPRSGIAEVQKLEMHTSHKIWNWECRVHSFPHVLVIVSSHRQQPITSDKSQDMPQKRRLQRLSLGWCIKDFTWTYPWMV